MTEKILAAWAELLKSPLGQNRGPAQEAILAFLRDPSEDQMRSLSRAAGDQDNLCRRTLDQCQYSPNFRVKLAKLAEAK